MLAFSASGFAPFAFSPVSFAILALIEELREERHGGGGRGRSPSRTPHRASMPVQRGRHQDWASEELVRAQWELLELRHRLQAQDAAAAPSEQTRYAIQRPTVDVATPKRPMPQALAAAPASVATLMQESREQAGEHDLALLLLLSEA